ncbi:aminoglycoside phosphotransferase family protein [Paenibacillus endoradicis]|uniref:aminoglycoside phosphotransferase family protein n=1 Tax=Paenibacillus endoradicis TaxID=2972487 RepID=UPI002158C022|nr:aminoglycoside phosphotransferase family protein [Paenibacillus endoradicis]MCR8656646.1 phosphotransferase [Paenibacillus endoradicis]
MEIIGQGRTAEIYDAHENKVLKLYRKEFPHQAINEEFLNSKFVYALGINTPKPFEMTEIDDRQGIIFQRISGLTLLNIMTRNPLRIKYYSQKLATLHYQLHSYEANELRRKQRDVIMNNVNMAPILTEEEKKKIINYLEGLPEDNKLCHGDFHPDNILIDKNNAWIIDWMTGMVGNPSADIARSVILLTYGTMHEGTPKLITTIVKFIRKRINNEYVKHYLKHSGKDYIDIDKWVLPMAAARLVEWIPQTEKNELVLEIRRRLNSIL